MFTIEITCYKGAQQFYINTCLNRKDKRGKEKGKQMRIKPIQEEIIKQRNKESLGMAKAIKEEDGETIKLIKEEEEICKPIKGEGKEVITSTKERGHKNSRNLAIDRDTPCPVCNKANVYAQERFQDTKTIGMC